MRKFCAAALATIASLAANSTELENGFWRSEGYGEALHIEDERFRHFEVTAISCVDRGVKPRSQLRRLVGTPIIVELGPSGAPLSVTVRRGVSQYVWRRTQDLPGPCRSAPSGVDPVSIFDIVWQTVAENYAFFRMRGVDWAEVRNQYRSRVSENTDDEALLSVVSEMLGQLQDRHVRLRAGDQLFVSGRRPAAEADPDGLLPQYSSLQPAWRQFVAANVLPHMKVTANDQIWWGRLEADIGYVAIKSLWDFTGRAGTDQDVESQAAADAMETVLRDLAGARAIIVDLRFNNGGSDAVGLAAAGPFVDRERVAFTKSAVDGMNMTLPYEIRIVPSARIRFVGPVVVLIGPFTASAAEVMTLALMTLPNVTLLGSRTMGLFSDTLYRQLPNGWTFTVSNEVYRTPSGQMYEGSGIPPTLWSKAASHPMSKNERFGKDVRLARGLIRASLIRFKPKSSASAAHLR